MTIPSARQWDSRSYDAAAYTQAILQERSERLSVNFDVCFITLDSPHDSSPPQDYLAVAHSSGQIRIYQVKDLMQQWVMRKASGAACLAWQAHAGPAYSLSRLGAGGASDVLVSGGDDGWLRAWRLSDIAAALSAGASGTSNCGAAAPGRAAGAPASVSASSPALAELQPCWTAQLPRVDSIWGSTGSSPGVVCAAVAGASSSSASGPASGSQAQALCVGASDGGVHVFDVAASAGGQQQRPLRSMGGHAAGVLAMDVSCTGQLGSGSEDGTVRLWDVRASGEPCTCAINPWDGVTLPPSSPAQSLQCVRGPYVSSVKFASEGGWLLMGTGNRALTLWSISLGALAKQQSTPMVPQATAFVPGEILVAGSVPSLLRYRFSALDAEPTQHAALSTRSTFGMAVHSTVGSIALCGASGLDLVSAHGARLGAVWHTAAED